MMAACTADKCPHDNTIAQQGAALSTLTQLLNEMRTDLKEVKSVVQVIGMVQVETTHQKEALTRVFARLETLEKEKAHDHEVDALSDRITDLETAKESYDAFINRVEGMKSLAWMLWSVLAGGLGIVILRLFVMAGPV